MKTISLLTVSLASLLAGSSANADDLVSRLHATDDLNSLDHQVAAPANAFEIAVAAGYMQGVGPISGGMQHVENISRGGAAFELDAMYRINPTFAVGAYSSLSKYATEINLHTDVLGATAGIQAVAHLRPEHSMDPWVSLGTGWHGLWQSPDSGKNTSLQGLELARLQLGVDYRVSENVAIAPMIGGSLNFFVAEDSSMSTGYTEIADKRVHFVGFAGIAGRFDVGGRR
jgi:hypothetical protein